MVSQKNTFDAMTAECLLPCVRQAMAQDEFELLDGSTACQARFAFVGRQADKAAVNIMLPVFVLQKRIEGVVQD